MKRTTFSLSAALFALVTTPVLADTHQHNMKHSDMQMSADSQTASKGHMGSGVVNKIDMQHNKINLTHGPIASLGWPGMTMDFKVKDAALLKGLKPGQQVTFEVVNEGSRQYFVTRILPQK